MTVLITGATGFLGPYLMAEFSRAPSEEIIGTARSGCELNYDLTDEHQVKDLMRKTTPSVIVHAAALTSVDKCELEPVLAIRTNVRAVRNLVGAMPPDCRFVYISTDMVYSGEGPHHEDSISENPINMYGLTKYMGEFEARKAPNSAIIRTNIFGSSKQGRASSLVDSMIKAMRGGGVVNLFTDSLFSPLYAGTLAKILTHIASVKRTGTYNIGSRDGMSKAKFALLLAHHLELPTAGLRPARADMIPGRVKRPLDTRMNVSKAVNEFGLYLPRLETEVINMRKAL